MEFLKIDAQHFLVRLVRGEEIVASLKKLAEQEQIKLAMVQGLGAVNDLTVGVFDTVTKEYKSNHFTGAFEMLSLTGTIDTMNGEFYSHYHIAVGDKDGHAWGGHLNAALISATAELILTLLPGKIDRFKDPEVGLNLWKLH
jgi:predicted DNA-binding protein with PD1-like motif